jgi:UV DNA damage endonuclease
MAYWNRNKKVNSDRRIGFACKILPQPTHKFETKAEAQAWLKRHNTAGTTVRALNSLDRNKAIAKIAAIVANNAQALCKAFEMLGSQPQSLRMMRIGSEIMPARTHPQWREAYENESEIRTALMELAKAGELARKHDIRLSTHPSQFTMLVSSRSEVVDRAIEDLNYHSEIFRLMGFDSSDQRQEINIHGGAKLPEFLQVFRANFARLPSDTKNWLSVENDEFSYCLDDLLPLADTVKLCVDINHYWIHQGNYLAPDDPRLPAVIHSWRGARPEMHVAWPSESVIGDHDPETLPNMKLLEDHGHRRAHLRAHSNSAWNRAISCAALEFWPYFDLMVEAKFKNLTAQQLWQESQPKKQLA